MVIKWSPLFDMLSLHFPHVFDNDRLLHLHAHYLGIYFLDKIGRYITFVAIILPNVPSILVGLIEQKHHLFRIHIQAVAKPKKIE